MKRIIETQGGEFERGPDLRYVCIHGVALFDGYCEQCAQQVVEEERAQRSEDMKRVLTPLAEALKDRAGAPAPGGRVLVPRELVVKAGELLSRAQDLSKVTAGEWHLMREEMQQVAEQLRACYQPHASPEEGQ